MMVIMDFGRMLAQADSPVAIEPRELYASLPNKVDGYGYLRDVQGQVLTKWHERRGEQDLVIKVNTGAGKTIDGLVILQSYLNAGEGPALYVAPSKYLAERVREEAARIGVLTVDDPDNAKYRSGEAICVINVNKLFNGKSVFRGDRPTLSPAPIGAVVIDDAHAALATARASLSIDIPYKDPAFGELLNLFRPDLEAHSANDLLDVVDQSPSAVLRVPFWSWRSHLEEARAILHKFRNSDGLAFAWPAVKDVLPYCRAVFTGRQLTITPLCSPVAQITNFHEAKHRIYLTATLADDSVLVTDFGADPTSVAVPITPTSAGDIGERMILAPMELNPTIAPELARNAIAALADKHNVVVIVPSTRAATMWTDYAAEGGIVYADDVGATVKRLRTEHVGLVVFVNKYDGIDLPGDACRVLVLDGLPESFSGKERLETQLTSRTSGFDDRQVQRIEQGMGRGVRSNEDHCVVFLLGARLTQLVNDPDTFAMFSPATQAQLRQSRQIAGDLADQPLSAIMGVAQQLLDRDEDWIKFARSALAGILPAPGNVSAAAGARRRAFDAAVAGDISGALQALTDAVNATSDVRQQGWLLEQQAVYIDRADPERAQKVLTAARAKNSDVLRPLSGNLYQKLSPTAEQAAAASDHLVRLYGNDPTKLRVAFEALIDNLRFNPDRVEAFEQGLRDLALHIGLAAQRPEHEIGDGPDGLWALGNLKFWVIEAKSGAVAKFISRHYINQLAGSINWFRQRYDASVTATPIMIHPSDTLSKDASPVAGARIITEAKMALVCRALRAFADALVAAGRWDDPDIVAGLLTGHKLRASDLYSYTVPLKTT